MGVVVCVGVGGWVWGAVGGEMGAGGEDVVWCVGGGGGVCVWCVYGVYGVCLWVRITFVMYLHMEKYFVIQ